VNARNAAPRRRTTTLAAIGGASLLVGFVAWRLLFGGAGDAASPRPLSDATRLEDAAPHGAFEGGAASRPFDVSPIPALPFEEFDRASRAAAPASPTSTDGVGRLSVRAVWDDDGTPAVGIRGWFLSDFDRVRFFDFANELPAYVSDAEGRFPTVALPAPRTEFRTDRWTTDRLAVHADRDTRAVVRIAAGIDVVVAVETADGAPVANAKVWLSTDVVLRGADVGETDVAGLLKLRSIRPWATVAVRAPGFQCSEGRVVRPTFLSGETLRFTLNRNGGALSGVVRYADGSPAEGAVVEARTHATTPDSSAQENVDVQIVPTYATRVDRDGRFAFEALSSGLCDVAVRSDKALGHLEEVSIPEGGEAKVELVLSRGHAVVGTVFDAAGGTLAGAIVELRRKSGDREFLVRSVATDRNGAYRIDGAQPGEASLKASYAGKGSIVVRAELGGEATRRVDLALDRSLVLSGRVVHRGGVPMERGRVTAFPPMRRAEAHFFTLEPNGDGAFAFEFEDATPMRLEVGDDLLRSTVVVEEATPGGPPLLLEIDSPPHDAFVTARFVDERGAPIMGAALFVRPTAVESRGKRSPNSGRDGRVSLGPLPAGTFEFVAYSSSGLIENRFRTAEVRALETLDLGDVVVETPGSLHVFVRDPDGHPPTDCVGRIFRDVGGSYRQVGGFTSSGTRLPFPPGSYVAVLGSRRSSVDSRFGRGRRRPSRRASTPNATPRRSCASASSMRATRTSPRASFDRNSPCSPPTASRS
jgi:hypothetical protein